LPGDNYIKTKRNEEK